MARKMVITNGNTRTRRKRRHQNLQNRLLPRKRQSLRKKLRSPNLQQKKPPDAGRGLSPSLSLNLREGRGWDDQTETIFLSR